MPKRLLRFPPRRSPVGPAFYPDVIDKRPCCACASPATILYPDGNKRVAYLALLEFLARNEIDWKPPSVDETVATIEGVADGRITERELADWLRTGLE